MNEQKPIKFNNEANCLVDYNELEKAIVWYQEKPTVINKKIYMFGSYPAVSIHNEKVHVHRLLMAYWLKTKIPTEYSVHHINHNKLDSRKENLSLVLNSAHNSAHMKGVKLSSEHRKKIGEANKRRKGIKMKKRHNIPTHELSDLLNYGFSILAISKLYEVDWSTVKSRIHEDRELLEGKVMKKGKNWLLHEITKLPCEVQSGHVKIKVVDVLPLIDKLDEPEKVVIPKFVADWIEKYIKYGYDLYPALEEMEKNSRIWKKTYGWYRKNTCKFVNAYLTGEYEVEEEQKYIVSDNSSVPLLIKNDDGKVMAYDSQIAHNNVNGTIELTEKEIKDYDERYWSFAVEVTE